MKRTGHAGRNTFIAGVIALVVASFLVPAELSHQPKQPPPVAVVTKQVTVLTPRMARVTGADYKAVVNEAGGMNLKHWFIYGRYSHGVWYPGGKWYVWRK